MKERDVRKEFQSITEHLIAEVDHADEDLRKICYDLYEESLREEFSITVAAERLRQVQPQPAVLEEIEDRCIQIRQQPYEEEEEGWEPEEEEAELSLLERLQEYFEEWKARIFHGVVSKRKELFPLPKEEEDFVFDAQTLCEPKTQMLSEVVVQKVTKLVCEGNGNGPEIVLDGDTITVGSKVGDNTVTLPSPAVSRYHARIRKNPEGKYQLEDLNSINGTYCNGQLLSYHEPHVLQRMDQILFADVAYRAV
ncbi:MAG: FHA domain-containing protein [Lachnospiraceae bacterium]|nr:FHA domain-containing protein [Lachnospiraceae bacterium]